jgi:hypothetical protein
MEDRDSNADRIDGPSCRVNSTFNFSVGAVSVAVGAALIWLASRYFSG